MYKTQINTSKPGRVSHRDNPNHVFEQSRLVIDGITEQPVLNENIEAEKLKKRILKLFSSKISLHLSETSLHYNAIRHELKEYRTNLLRKALKELVSSRKLYKYQEQRSYKTTIFTTKRVKTTKRLEYHTTIEDCIKILNPEKGQKLEILVYYVLKKLDSKVRKNFQNPLDKRRDLDVFSDNFIIECKNWSRSHKIGKREVDKFIENLNYLSATPLRASKTPVMIGTHFTNSAKKLLDSEGILYIEIGFQVISYSCRNTARLLFARFNFAMAKDTATSLSMREVYIKLFYYLFNSLKKRVSVNSTSWGLVLRNTRREYAKLIEEDLYQKIGVDSS